MRKGLGVLLLLVGVVALGWWALARHAPAMEAEIARAAAVAVAGSPHAVATEVAGRDIRVSGLADGPADRDRLINALEAVPGRRVVIDALQVLPLVAPFQMRARWRGGVISAQGHAPDEAAREELAQAGATGLQLGAGAPDDQWSAAVVQGLAGLRLLDEGDLLVSGRGLLISGVAQTPVEGAALDAAMADLPSGYTVTTELSYLDDGTPPAYALHYSVAEGLQVTGKLPQGLAPEDLARALGLAAVTSDATQALIGDPGTVPPGLNALTPWMAEVETLEVSIAPEGTLIVAGFGAGADTALLAEALGADLAGASTGLALRVEEVAATGATGDTRTNPVSGATEVLSGGYWLPTPDFARDAPGCAAAVEAVLGARRIGFVTGSAQLDARARGAVNALAGVLVPCLGQVGLRAEIGGHTDNTGDAAANLALSIERAEAVRTALIGRGVAEAALTAQGYGAAEPIADNTTEAGRAANRRTAVRWIE